jgi:hypothetical protein
MKRVAVRCGPAAEHLRQDAIEETDSFALPIWRRRQTRLLDLRDNKMCRDGARSAFRNLQRSSGWQTARALLPKQVRS